MLQDCELVKNIFGVINDIFLMPIIFVAYEICLSNG